ncbi:hypothetical protein CcCBS67573_g06138 [Chytriomyces confervae]|uniref:Uncharacterized protein n=1 Tax=Chytriomyces confervae TaxID=246404 RepID=A0A507F7K7_9FUNG|nr:hypothetical protein CcCBS67573_g06138 [Chytriomyces confervae]
MDAQQARAAVKQLDRIIAELSSLQSTQGDPKADVDLKQLIESDPVRACMLVVGAYRTLDAVERAEKEAGPIEESRIAKELSISTTHLHSQTTSKQMSTAKEQTTTAQEQQRLTGPSPAADTFDDSDYDDHFDLEREYPDDFGVGQGRSERNKRNTGTGCYTSKHVRIQSAKQEKRNKT